MFPEPRLRSAYRGCSISIYQRLRFVVILFCFAVPHYSVWASLVVAKDGLREPAEETYQKNV